MSEKRLQIRKRRKIVHKITTSPEPYIYNHTCGCVACEQWRKGVLFAAEFVEMFDKHVSHPYRLSDCILAKFNMRDKKDIRKNKGRLAWQT